MNTKTFIAIGLSCALIVIAVLIVNYSQSVAPTDAITASVVSENVAPANNKDRADKVLLVTTCELAIKPQLKNPKSFDVDMNQTKVYDQDGMLVLDMFYYAENSYGASAINEVFCEFSYRGTLLNIMHA